MTKQELSKSLDNINAKMSQVYEEVKQLQKVYEEYAEKDEYIIHALEHISQSVEITGSIVALLVLRGF